MSDTHVAASLPSLYKALSSRVSSCWRDSSLFKTHDLFCTVFIFESCTLVLFTWLIWYSTGTKIPLCLGELQTWCSRCPQWYFMAKARWDPWNSYFSEQSWVLRSSSVLRTWKFYQVSNLLADPGHYIFFTVLLWLPVLLFWFHHNAVATAWRRCKRKV